MLLEGLSGAADYGTASAFGRAGVSRWRRPARLRCPAGRVGLVVALVAGRQADARPRRRRAWWRRRSTPRRWPPICSLRPQPCANYRLSPDTTHHAPARRDRARPRSGSRARPLRPDAGRRPHARRNDRRWTTTSHRCWRARDSRGRRCRAAGAGDHRADLRAGQPQPPSRAKASISATPRTARCCGRHRRDTARRRGDRRGRVLLQQGQPAFVFYSAWCGGALGTGVAGVARRRGLRTSPRSKTRPASGEAPWTSEMRAADVERALRAAGLRGGRLRDLRVLQRNASGRVVAAARRRASRRRR